MTEILPPVSRFAEAGGHSAEKRTMLREARRLLRLPLQPQLIPLS
jgi:hypothetical protein